MKSILSLIAAGSLLAALAVAQPHYTVTDLGVLGKGVNSSGFGINNAGWVGGSSDLTPGGPQHAFLWFGRGPLIDIGTLGGAACPACNSGANTPNVFAQSAVGSETAVVDSLGEDFCGYGTHHQCLAAIWSLGRLRALPTLRGGHNADDFGVNNWGQVIGFSENGVHDESCKTLTPFQVTRYEAVIWEPNGAIRELSPLKSKGDTVAFGFGINDRGQAVGSSGSCSTQGLPPQNPNGLHAVLWEADGSVHDLGNLGGTSGNIATSINDNGAVAGNSQSSKDGNLHAFRWTRQTGMQELDALPGAFATIAPCCNTINDKGEVTGFSIDANGTRAVVWEGQKIYDLNKLIPANSPLFLLAGYAINDAGEITGQACVMPACTVLHAFRARPVDREGEEEE